jgi:deglycase
MDQAAVAFARNAVKRNLVEASCHSPWTLVEADVVRGRTITSYPSVATDVRHSGANWLDQEVAAEGEPDQQPQRR